VPDGTLSGAKRAPRHGRRLTLAAALNGDGRVVLGSALVVGLLARLLIFSQTSELGPKIQDEQHYTQIATNLLDGSGFAWAPGQLTSIRPPLYPAMLAGIWSIAGHANFQAVRLVQIVLALVASWLVFEIGRRAFDDRVGRYAAAVLWLYPSWVFFNFTILTETLFTTLLLAFVLAAIALVRSGHAGMALLCGVALGLAALTRSVLWPLPLLFCPLLVVLLPTPLVNRLLVAALVFVGYAIPVVPWAIRNTTLQKTFTVVDTMGGLNLRMGNYEHTPDDRMWAVVGLEGEKSWSHALNVERPGEVLTEGQKDKWAQRKAVEYMRTHPGETLRRSFIKFADFWGLEREYTAGVNRGMYRPPFWLGMAVSALMVAAYVVVVGTGAAGIWLARPDIRTHVLLLLPVVVTMGAHTIVFGHSRYHLPLMPFFGLYGAALLGARERIAWRSHRVLILCATVSLLVLAAVWFRQLVLVDAGRLSGLLGHV
jgi:4-amino-4-deoxy-L-arabinose transferase-like glycosyltransferase